MAGLDTLNAGPGVHGAAQVRLDVGWANSSSNETSTLEVVVASVLLARLTTTSGNGTTATIFDNVQVLVDEPLPGPIDAIDDALVISETEGPDGVDLGLKDNDVFQSAIVTEVNRSASNLGVAVSGSNGGLFTIGADGRLSFDATASSARWALARRRRPPPPTPWPTPARACRRRRPPRASAQATRTPTSPSPQPIPATTARRRSPARSRSRPRRTRS